MMNIAESSCTFFYVIKAIYIYGGGEREREKFLEEKLHNPVFAVSSYIQTQI